MRTIAVGIVILFGLSASLALAEDPNVNFTYDQKTKTGQIVSPGIVAEVDATEELFNANLEAMGAEEIQFRKVIIDQPIELGAFCRDLSSILDCTVIVPANLRKLTVPECTLRRVNLAMALDAIAEAADGQFQFDLGDTGKPIRSGEMKIRVTDARPDPDAAVVVGRIFRLPPVDDKAKPTAVDDSLNEILDLTKSAIETLASAKGQPIQKLPTIKMHPQSHILIVAGTVEEIEIIGSVVTALGGEVVEVPNVRGAPPAMGAMGGGMGGFGGGMGGMGGMGGGMSGGMGGGGGGGGGFH